MDNKIDLVVNDLISYSNVKKLSWMKVYKDIINKYDISYDDNIFLHNVIREISIRGYDIIDKPFKLEKYK